MDVQVCPALTDAALNALLAHGSPITAPRGFGPILARSLVYCAIFRDGMLIGFVNVAWDGGIHAFLLDPTVHPDYRRQGLGLALVRTAVAESTARGAEWMHVDFESRLSPFYKAAGFRATEAGVIRLAG